MATLRWTVLPLMAFASLLPPASSQQAGQGVGWAHSWEGALEEARLRNVPIFVSVQQDNNPGCTAMESAFKDAGFIKAFQAVVTVVANGEQTHGNREVKVDGRKTLLCKIYDGISCEHHLNCNTVTGMLFKSGAAFDVPTQVWLKIDDKSETGFKEMFRHTGPQGTGAQTAADLCQDLKRALSLSGTKGGLSKKEYMECRKYLEEVQALSAKQEFKKCIELLKKLAASSSEYFKKQGEEQLKDVERQGDQMVQIAEENWAKDPKAAREFLVKVIKEFDPSWPCVKKAKEVMDKHK